MDKYRKSIRLRMIGLGIVIVVAVALSLYDALWASAAMKANHIFSFQCGLTVGVGLIAVVLLVRFGGSLKDENKLKLQYNAENDERLKAIRAKAGMPMLLITSVLMIIAGVIAGHFNVVVFYTLIATAMGQMMIGATAKIINMRRM